MLQLLIVEDEEILRTGLSTCIPWRELGYDLAGVAGDGEDAMAFIRNHWVDVMLSDIKMPGISGLSLAKWVRQEYQNIEIILMSGYDEFDFAREALRISVKEYLLKPLDLLELTSIMQRLQVEITNRRQKEPEYHQLFSLPPQQKGFTSMFRYDSTLLLSLIRTGDREGIQLALQHYSQELDNQKIESYLQWLMVFSNLFHDVISLPEEIGCNVCDTIGDPNTCLNNLIRLQKRNEIIRSFQQVCEKISDLFLHEGQGRQRSILAKALQYMNEHYADQDLMLNDVAQTVYISASYLNLILKKFLGKTFTELLTQIRMEQAKQLLYNTQLKTYEISFLCGYANPSYFSTVFKGYFDCAPSRLRQQSKLPQPPADSLQDDEIVKGNNEIFD